MLSNLPTSSASSGRVHPISDIFSSVRPSPENFILASCPIFEIQSDSQKPRCTIATKLPFTSLSHCLVTTGATSARAGAFERANKGTIFLDEVGELPLTTQVRLLRVLENGEFLKVGSSQVQKTNVRIVAATNVNMFEAIKKEKFREDLYYRLSTVEISLPPLRDRRDDIHLLFRKFASDFGQKYKMPTIRLEDDAVNLLLKYRWPGNIRQLRNIAEQVSVLEENRNISASTLNSYLPNSTGSNLPAVVGQAKKESDFSNERYC